MDVWYELIDRLIYEANNTSHIRHNEKPLKILKKQKFLSSQQLISSVWISIQIDQLIKFEISNKLQINFEKTISNFSNWNIINLLSKVNTFEQKRVTFDFE